MSQPYIGEIRMFGGNFPPLGWAFCNGALLPISENDTLFALIGTTYGGDGESTFALPNLQSRMPVHRGPTRTFAETGGVEQVTLTVQQIPNHSHVPVASAAAGTSNAPAGNVWAANSNTAMPQFATNPSPQATMNAATVSPTGGSQPHENMPPFTCVSFIISLFGIFPSQS